ncbi:protein-glutamate O-methyltransferase CheR [bacterium]|nr:protein-glutamate O-methyltransferase CheR [Rubripirellula sp.]MDA7492798.1 protein-glutamate O-methyltransferase CheR [bacterium]MDB4654039.1 protein-glutamate O-methyltransferase CheR [bacterium]MDB4654235.1 protein-glutamate O-methyltransferase CheR [Rubripirellula sp.]
MTIRPDTFEYIRDALHQRTAIRLMDNKEYLVETRLSVLARKNGLLDVDALVDQLKIPGSSVLWHEVVDAMTTNETSFFRDNKPFEVLRDRVLPALMEHSQDTRQLHIWSAASASGQEAYSIAMLWEEIRNQYPLWDLDILATDISNNMLERGREGSYSDLEVIRGLSERRLADNFRRSGDRWLLNEKLKKNVNFQYLNLIHAWPTLPKMDIVFIRNVLVYFDHPTKCNLFAKVRKIMKPNGFLFLGGAESALTIDDQFERVFDSGGSCYRLKSEDTP